MSTLLVTHITKYPIVLCSERDPDCRRESREGYPLHSNSTDRLILKKLLLILHIHNECCKHEVNKMKYYLAKPIPLLPDRMWNGLLLQAGKYYSITIVEKCICVEHDAIFLLLIIRSSVDISQGGEFAD